jgi:hypothetical protein
MIKRTAPESLDTSKHQAGTPAQMKGSSQDDLDGKRYLVQSVVPNLDVKGPRGQDRCEKNM